MKRQNNRKISVIIGNPPYNAKQQDENENNPNRPYTRESIVVSRQTYIRASGAKKIRLFDMYARFLRWASDRLRTTGLMAFVTNRSLHRESRNFDGFRKPVGGEVRRILDHGSGR